MTIKSYRSPRCTSAMHLFHWHDHNNFLSTQWINTREACLRCWFNGDMHPLALAWDMHSAAYHPLDGVMQGTNASSAGAPAPCLSCIGMRYTSNSLGPSDTIWRQRSGSTLAQAMACCLTAPSHYLNQCWLILSKVQWYSSDGNLIRDTPAINH